jgi:hypothetical protein
MAKDGVLLVVVRAGGYVGCIANAVDGVQAYLEGLIAP